jgi:hypothetical protein
MPQGVAALRRRLHAALWVTGMMPAHPSLQDFGDLEGCWRTAAQIPRAGAVGGRKGGRRTDESDRSLCLLPPSSWGDHVCRRFLHREGPAVVDTFELAVIAGFQGRTVTRMVTFTNTSLASVAPTVMVALPCFPAA